MNEKKIENLITETVRALYSKPRLTPKIEIFRPRRERIAIEVDVSPWNPGLLIGQDGSMKFALQLLIAYAFGLSTDGLIDIHVASSKRLTIERTEPADADASKIEPVSSAIADILDGEFEIEVAKTSAMVHFTLPHDIARDVKPPLSKVIRACGKAAGFNALPYVHVRK